MTTTNDNTKKLDIRFQVKREREGERDTNGKTQRNTDT